MGDESPALHPRLRRLAEALARQPGLRRLLQWCVPRVDRWLSRLTGGRWQLGSIALPMLVLAVQGRRSGRRRETSLLYVPDGEDVLVVGSNFGRPEHPAWSHNLLAADVATINVRGRETTVRPVLLEGAEREAVWPLLLRTWPVYREYEEEAGRTLRVFRLRPVDDA